MKVKDAMHKGVEWVGPALPAEESSRADLFGCLDDDSYYTSCVEA
jgi:hypothetical protein